MATLRSEIGLLATWSPVGKVTNYDAQLAEILPDNTLICS